MSPKKVLAVPAPTLQKDGSVNIYLRLTNCNPDGVQYKPYSSSFEPLSPVIVQINVKPEHILSFDGTNLILTPRGWYSVAKVMATASVLAAGG